MDLKELGIKGLCWFLAVVCTVDRHYDSHVYKLCLFKKIGCTCCHFLYFNDTNKPCFIWLFKLVTKLSILPWLPQDNTEDDTWMSWQIKKCLQAGAHHNPFFDRICCQRYQSRLENNIEQT